MLDWYLLMNMMSGFKMAQNRNARKGKKQSKRVEEKARVQRPATLSSDYYDHEMLQIKQMLARQRGNEFCHCGTEYPSNLPSCPTCA